MTFSLCMFLFMVFLLVCCALFTNRRFRTGFKIPGAYFFFEADDHNGNSASTKAIADAAPASTIAPLKPNRG